jgi:flagellar protein FlaG
MTSINETAQSAPAVKAPATTSIDAPSVPVVVDQAQSIRQDSAADAGKQAPPSGDAKKTVASDAQVMHAVQEMKDYAQSIDRDLKFNVDDDSGRLIITVIDPETDKIVRQIPPEDTLYILRNMQRGGGALFDNKV